MVTMKDYHISISILMMIDSPCLEYLSLKDNGDHDLASFLST